MVKNLPANAGDEVRSLGCKDSLEEESGNPHQYSCSENPMDRGAWWATVHGVTKSWTQRNESRCLNSLKLLKIYLSFWLFIISGGSLNSDF